MDDGTYQATSLDHPDRSAMVTVVHHLSVERLDLLPLLAELETLRARVAGLEAQLRADDLLGAAVERLLQTRARCKHEVQAERRPP